MTDRELMQQALEALITYDGTNGEGRRKRVLAALRERLAQPEHEPVAWKDKTYGNLHHQDFGNSIPLYTTPQPAVPERKPLSDGEILGMWPDTGFPRDVLKFARAIETAHGIKEKNT